MTFDVVLVETVLPDILGNLNLVVFIPGERVSRFKTNIPADTNKMEALLVTIPNIEWLHLSVVELSKGFLQPNPDGPRANAKLLPSLQSLCLDDVSLSDDDWGHLTTYLARSKGISLDITDTTTNMCREVAKEVENMVGKFGCTLGRLTECPFGRCEGMGESERSDDLS